MGIFAIHRDPVKAGRSLCDRHLVVMAKEAAQMVSTVARKQGLGIGLKSTHANHPCTLWAGKSRENFEWLLTHGLAICSEYSYRYLGRHASVDALRDVKNVSFLLNFPEQGLTPFAQAMPEKYRGKNAVLAYRRFYIGEKAYFARWKNGREAPRWWPVGS